MSRRVYTLSTLLLFVFACGSSDTPFSDGLGASGERDDAGEPSGQDDDQDGDESTDNPPGGDGDGDASDGDAGTECATVLRATIRDFRADHADFGNLDFISDVSLQGIVESELGQDKKPVYAHAGATEETTGPSEFAEWYNDVPGTNMAFAHDIPLVADGAGTYVFDSQTFFPLDGRGFGNEDADGAGTLRNFHFTTEIHTSFTYRGGEIFTFNGDDDVWVFINGKLAIDLGGLHPKLLESVSLDEASGALGISAGGTYDMDIFHAERLAKDSTFRIETTIDCLIPVVL
jgi:fibro-slime domain-containing protein